MRFGTTSYFLGLVKLTGDFKTYYVQQKKTRVVFCETRLAPARPKSQKQKPLTRVMVYLFGTLGLQAQTYYQKGDYVLVQGRLKIVKKQDLKSKGSQTPPLITKEYHLNIFKMSLICRP
jgi:single-stranded DNA-binding protein|tara:strand:- start:302 stop:658 length:357 start_codon:yes stop_codon:yes gene_type:complete